MKGYIMLAYLALVMIHWTQGALILKGPEGPVLEGDYVTLECLADVESNMSQIHFEKFSKRMQKWFRLEPYEMSFYRRCFSYDLDLNREPGRIVLSIFAIQSWTNGPYRCVSDNTSELYNSSESLSIPVHYMRDLSVYRVGGSYYNRYFSSLQDLRVPLGDSVEVECSTSASEMPEYSWKKEGEDWVVLSSKLKLKKVRIEDSGKYTCTAQHPSISRLSKMRAISITVLPEDAPWYESTQGRIILMTSVAGVVLLLLAVSVSICLRASKRTTKGPIDDHSQKKPIYTASIESLPSTSGDKQPLV